MRHGSLFSGIGGFDLAAEWMGWQNIFHCEWNEFGQQILKYYWPEAISYHDIKKTDFSKHRGTIDILTGGFPCQGFSLAGLRLGTDDDRYLWPEYLRAIDEIGPAWVVGENVTGILSMEDKSGIYRNVFAKVESRKITRFREVDHYEAIYTRQAKMLVGSICESLEERGYEVQTFALPAASVQAPHQRERIWFVAHANNKGRSAGFGEVQTANGEIPERNDDAEFGDASNGNATDTESDRDRGRTAKSNRETAPTKEWTNSIDQTKRLGVQWDATNANGIGLRGQNNRPGKPRQLSKVGAPTKWDNWPTQSPVCAGDDGFSTGLDGLTFSKWRNESIKAGGNAIVPQVVFEIFKAIEAYEKAT